MDKDYISIKRKTLVRWFFHSTIVFLLFVGYYAESQRKAPFVPTWTVDEQRYVLRSADGYEVSLGPSLLDSTSVVSRHKTAYQRELDELLKRQEENDYYLSVHRVHEEGYNVVMKQQENVKQLIAKHRLLLSMLDTLDASSSTVALLRLTTSRRISAPSVFLVTNGGNWQYGHYTKRMKEGRGVMLRNEESPLLGRWEGDTLISGTFTTSTSHYHGQLSSVGAPQGHGQLMTGERTDYEGHFSGGLQDGFGVSFSGEQLRAGEWRYGRFLGERMEYTSERIYGIDISKYQHGKGRRYYPIHWNKLRITYLGRTGNKGVKGTANYPVSFIYIKSTEGTTIRNKYYLADYRQARRYGFRCGAYHFFSTKTSGEKQATFFLKQTRFAKGDLPPVLDVEPSDRQIIAMGGIDVLWREVLAWMHKVEKSTHTIPVLYISQNFVNKYLRQRPDIKRKYHVWIARYGEYKPDVRLAYWQLCSDGRVEGIQGDVDINVFNGYGDQFEEFMQKESIQ